MEMLEQRGATVAYHDPHVPVIPRTREHASLAGRSSLPLTPEALRVALGGLHGTARRAHLLFDFYEAVDQRLLARDLRQALCQQRGFLLELACLNARLVQLRDQPGEVALTFVLDPDCEINIVVLSHG